jgi:hypothetical protein
MSDLLKFAALFANAWGDKTLEELRCEADREETEIAFEALRASEGQRFMIVACVTDIDQIARLEQVLDLVDDNLKEDWNTLTLADVAMRSARVGGMCFEALRDEYGRRSALALIAVDPRSIRMVETLFELPK